MNRENVRIFWLAFREWLEYLNRPARIAILATGWAIAIGAFARYSNMPHTFDARHFTCLLLIATGWAAGAMILIQYAWEQVEAEDDEYRDEKRPEPNDSNEKTERR